MILVCEWTKHDHSHTIGGELQTSVSTLEGCKQACLVDMQCSHGFDWDSNELKCYVSRNNDIRAGANGVFHYVCKSEWSNDQCISIFNNNIIFIFVNIIFLIATFLYCHYVCFHNYYYYCDYYVFSKSLINILYIFN